MCVKNNSLSEKGRVPIPITKARLLLWIKGVYLHKLLTKCFVWTQHQIPTYIIQQGSIRTLFQVTVIISNNIPLNISAVAACLVKVAAACYKQVSQNTA